MNKYGEGSKCTNLPVDVIARLLVLEEAVNKNKAYCARLEKKIKDLEESTGQSKWKFGEAQGILR